MKLYDTPLAPNPRRVRWFMAEKGIEDIEIVRLSLMDGGHKTADYLKRFGIAHVPALELDDGTTLTESLAICRYLESCFPEPNLFGRTPVEAAVVEMWTRRGELLVAHPFMLGVRHLHPALAALEAQDAHVGAHSRDQALKALEVLDHRLAQSEWVAGDRFTIADIVTFVGVDFTRLLKLPVPETLVSVHRWMEAMRARPASKAGM